MKPPKKWMPGTERILTYGAFENAVKGSRVVFVERRFQSRPRAAMFIGQMPYLTVVDFIRHGSMTLAIQTDEYQEWVRSEVLGGGG